MASSRSRVRSVSTRMYAVCTGSSRNVAEVITPVRPSPPAVAQNTSGSSAGVTSSSSPVGVTRWNDATWAQKPPST